mmetsp:Transcript_66290/g.153951  ORF Transcript_66290/g.153951 Transcript_66290/m.153951 type:complete len:213 (-) Transcript_66290:160-798(-)
MGRHGQDLAGLPGGSVLARPHARQRGQLPLHFWFAKGLRRCALVQALGTLWCHNSDWGEGYEVSRWDLQGLWLCKFCGSLMRAGSCHDAARYSVARWQQTERCAQEDEEGCWQRGQGRQHEGHGHVGQECKRNCLRGSFLSHMQASGSSGWSSRDRYALLVRAKALFGCAKRLESVAVSNAVLEAQGSRKRASREATPRAPVDVAQLDAARG